MYVRSLSTYPDQVGWDRENDTIEIHAYIHILIAKSPHSLPKKQEPNTK